MNAIARNDLFYVAHDWTDPETGNRWIDLEIPGPEYTYDQVASLPKIIQYDSDIFARMSWNSDTGRVHYRNKAPVAENIP